MQFDGTLPTLEDKIVQGAVVAVLNADLRGRLPRVLATGFGQGADHA